MGKGRDLALSAMVRMAPGRTPDPGIWLFSSTDNRHFNYNSKPLFEYVLKMHPEIRARFVINDPALRRRMQEIYGEPYFISTDHTEGIRQALEAGVWFTSAGLPVYGRGIGKNRRIVNLWHGIPLKKIALLDPNLTPSSRLWFKAMFSDNYADIVTTSRFMVRVMAESFGVDEALIRTWGQPRCDILFRPVEREAYLKSVFSELPDYQKTILYAPTFRDGEGTRLFPFEDFDRKSLEAFLEKESAILLIRTHIMEQAGVKAFCGGRVLAAGEDVIQEVMDFLPCIDLLVTDYSSIYLDYILLDRPMLFLPYDREWYLKKRGLNFDYEEVTPGPKPDTFRKFCDDISEAFSGNDPYAEKRRKIRSLFYDEAGPCCEKICQEIIKGKG